jgi:nucleotide-binding universal stress UspA family protein
MGSLKKDRKRIVVAVDTSPHADVVVKSAAELASLVGADVSMVTVIDTVSIPAEGEVLTLEDSERNAVNHHRYLIEKHFTNASSILIESVILYGDAADKICEVAEKVHADLVVIGSRGLSKIQSVLLGSVSEKVIKKCSRSVLVVKV